MLDCQPCLHVQTALFIKTVGKRNQNKTLKQIKDTEREGNIKYLKALF